MAKNIQLPNATIAILNRFADEQRKPCLDWLRNTKGMSLDDAEDLFQNAFVTLYEQLVSGKLTEMPRSLVAYFHTICQYKLKEHFRDIENQMEHEDERDVADFNEDFLNEVLADEDASQTERKEAAVREVVRSLPDPCNKLLWGFYFDDLSMQELADRYNYKSADSVKVMKSRCMDRFQARMREIYNELFK